jgi:Helitron helicase-like domain at N-terminus
MLQFKTAQTAIRDSFNPIISAGKLFQQWCVDSYLQVEANNLNFVRYQQSKLRSELYQGLADHLANAATAAGVQARLPIILPSSFEGSPRNMRERLQDAMSIFGKHGPPDLFITFTANPTWNEIISNLQRGEAASDRPDLVARVFKLKLKALMEDLTVNHVLGRCTAFVYTVEFQKRGLPYAHILIVLENDYKFKTPERIDEVVSAEIPEVRENSRLFEIVTRCMMHGPCGASNPYAPCMEDGKCKKRFPKDFQQTTATNVDGYPLYRRREGYTVEVRGKVMDNRFVVPHNRFLLLKYNGHINVEVCTSLKAVKYIYKYIYKGFDCANVVVGNGDNQRMIHDEIATYLDARYVSAPEAMWRLLESPMHDRSHAVIRLPVHLHQQQRITFEVGNEQEAINQAQTGTTKLTAWFKLNRDDPTANHLLYTEIPLNYVYKGNSWSKRQRGGNNIVPRMYTVGLNDQERFYLRLLLLHVPGATSYEYLGQSMESSTRRLKKELFIEIFSTRTKSGKNAWKKLQFFKCHHKCDRLLHSFAFIACLLILHIYGKLFVNT